MYLSCLMIDPGSDPDRPRPARRWLRNLYRVHQRLCMAFPSDTRRTSDPAFLDPYRPQDFATADVHVPRGPKSGFLFRIDSRPGASPIIVVQSANKPDWDYAFHNAMHLLSSPPQVKQFTPSFESGQLLRFRLRANPTRRVAKGPNKGQRVPVGFDDEANLAWLNRRGVLHGYRLIDVGVMNTGWGHSRRRSGEEVMRFWSVLFEGTLEVVDAKSFGAAIASGVGPAKAFGFGLLSPAPASGR